MLLTDIFAGLAVLALYLGRAAADDAAALGTRRADRPHRLRGRQPQRHAGHAARAVRRRGPCWSRCSAGALPVAAAARALALALSVAMLLGANYIVAKRLAWTPGGIALSFGRMLQDGIVARYLDEHCPDPRLRLCDHRESCRTTPILLLGRGRFQPARPLRRPGRRDAHDRPGEPARLSVAGVGPRSGDRRAARARATGYGVITEIWHTYGMIENFAALSAARHERRAPAEGRTRFRRINRLHVPVAFGSMLLLVGILGLGARGAALRRPRAARRTWRSPSSPMPWCSARCPGRMTAMARASPGWRPSSCCWSRCVGSVCPHLDTDCTAQRYYL